MSSDLKWKFGLAFLLVFVAGGMTGVFFGVHLLRHHVMLGPPHSGDVPGRMREHMRRTLGLTAEQEKSKIEQAAIKPDNKKEICGFSAKSNI